MFRQSKLHYLRESHRQPGLFRESLQKNLSDFGQKKDFLTNEKPGKLACWRYFFKCTSELGNTYQVPFLCTTETKLRVFQFKFLHRRVATNDFLLNIGKKETDSCSFSAGSPETLRIFFGIVDHFRLFGIVFRCGPPKIFIWPTWTLLHHFLLIARHYIYSCTLRNTIPVVQVYTQF